MKINKQKILNQYRKLAIKKLEIELMELNSLPDEELYKRYEFFSNKKVNVKSFKNEHTAELTTLQTIFDASPTSIWYKDTQNNFIKVNKAAAELSNMKIDDIEGRSADNIFPLEAKKYYNDDLEVIHSGKPKIGIVETITNQEVTKWVRTDKLPWYDEQGEVKGVIAFARDITEQKQVEERYRTVISNAPISIFATDENGIFILNEGKALEKLGMKPGENVGVSAYALFSALKVIEHNGTITDGESVLYRVSRGEFLSGLTELNGVVFDNQFAPIYDGNNQIKGLVGVATDITDLRKIESELILAKERLQFLVSNSPAVIYSCKLNDNYELTFISKNVFQVIGYHDFEFQKDPLLWEKLIHPEDIKMVLVNISNIYKTKHFQHEFRFKHQDNTYRWISDEFKLVEDATGKPLEIIGYRRDITERKLLLDALVKNEKELNEAQRLAKVGSWEWNYNSEKLKCTKEYYRIFDLDPELGRTSYKEHLKKYSLISKRKILQVIKECRFSGKKDVVDVQLKSKKWIKASVEATNDEGGKINGLRGTVQDITENKLDEEKRQFQAALAMNLSEGISLVRQKDGIIVFTNLNFEKIFAYQPGELIGKHASVLNAPEKSLGAQEIAQNIIESVKVNGRWKGEIRNVKKDGTLFYTQASISQFNHPEFGMVLLTIQMNIDKQKLLEHKLLTHQKELKNLSLQLVNIQEDGRKKLAQELHDEVGQSLTALKINLVTIMKRLSSGDKSLINERLSEMDEILEQIISQVHEISLDLRPAMLDVLGLLPTIKSYCNQFSKRTGILVHLDDDIKLNLNPEQEINLFRIVQEALTNVAKHSKAKNVIIKMKNCVDVFEMALKDDGCGFDTEYNESYSNNMLGIGLIGMRERITSLNGLFELDSELNVGTTIKISMPLK